MNNRKKSYIEVEEKCGLLFQNNPDNNEFNFLIQHLQSVCINVQSMQTKYVLELDHFADEWLQL